jgi:SAM-dependent methyltransferase
MSETPGVDQRALIEGNVPAGHYASRAYNTKQRFCSFWHQLDSVLELEPQTVLEVGPGDGLVTDWVRRAGIEVMTLDIDRRAKADIEGSATEMPVEADSHDVIVCCQVLEHLPYDQAEQALREIARVARVGAVISVPNRTPWVGIEYPLYYGLQIRQVAECFAGRGKLAALRGIFRRQLRVREALFLLLVPGRWLYGGKTWEAKRPPVPHRAMPPAFDGHHYWEIGDEGHTAETFLASLDRAGLDVEKEFRVPQNPWHHFFIVRARDAIS